MWHYCWCYINFFAIRLDLDQWNCWLGASMNYWLVLSQVLTFWTFRGPWPIKLVWIIKLQTETYVKAASPRLSASARRSVLSLSMTPHDACRTESNRQSPAVRFHSAYSLLPSTSVISTLQLITCSSSSSSSAPPTKHIWDKSYLLCSCGKVSQRSAKWDRRSQDEVNNSN